MIQSDPRCEDSSPSVVSSHMENRPLPRFNLKKRPINSDREKMTPLSSVNSAFLSGLFADVAKVQVTASPQETAEDPRLENDSSAPCKKTRLSKTKSMTRCGKSYKILSEATDLRKSSDELLKSPSGAATNFFGVVHNVSAADSAAMSRVDSLYYQLSCVSDSQSDCVQAGKLAFPHLPSTVSSSSCKLTRKVSDLQMSDSETTTKESYGWFVEMEDEPSASAAATTTTGLPDPYSTAATSSTSLAFTAATAPKAANYDAEVEWAQAADTVDDVLGDFF